MRTSEPKKVTYPPKVDDGESNIPSELIYVNESYITKIGIPSTADLFMLLENEDDPKTIEEMAVNFILMLRGGSINLSSMDWRLSWM